ncbi:hypothetical protein D3C78_1307340 [compost metagenome]
MNVLITRTFSGGEDLYHGIPNLEGAVVSNVDSVYVHSEYRTEPTLDLINGSKMKLIVIQGV